MGGDRCLIEVWHFLSTEILTINSSDQVYNRKMLKYTLILYCSFCLSFGDKNWVTSLLYQVLIKPIGKLSLLFFSGGGGVGCYLYFLKHRLHRCPTEEADMTRTEQPPTTTPPHSPEKKKSIFKWSMLVFQLSYNIIVLFAYPVVTILSSVTGVTFYYLFCSPFQNRAWD